MQALCNQQGHQLYRYNYDGGNTECSQPRDRPQDGQQDYESGTQKVKQVWRPYFLWSVLSRGTQWNESGERRFRRRKEEKGVFW